METVKVSVCCGTGFDHFAELEETCSLIDNLPQISHNFIALEASQEHFTSKILFVPFYWFVRMYKWFVCI